MVQGMHPRSQLLIRAARASPKIRNRTCGGNQSKSRTCGKIIESRTLLYLHYVQSMNNHLQKSHEEQQKAFETFHRDVEQWAEKGCADALSEIRVCRVWMRNEEY